MQLNYFQQQARESTSVAKEPRFSQGFQSPFSYYFQAGVSSGSEFSGLHGSEELQQFNFPSSGKAGFQLSSPGVVKLTLEAESGQDLQTPRSNNIHGGGSSSLSYRINCNPVAEIENKYNPELPEESSEEEDFKKIYDQLFSEVSSDPCNLNFS